MASILISILGKVAFISFAFIIGHYRYSPAWLIPIALTAIKQHYDEKRKIQLAVTHSAFLGDEREDIISRLDELPAWVIFPDVERVEWLNKIIKKLWPKINGVVEKMLQELEPKVRESNVMLEKFKITKIDFGRVVSVSCTDK